MPVSTDGAVLMELSLRIAVELHEHQIPDLDVTIQIVIFTAGATRHIRSVVKRLLSTARTGLYRPFARNCPHRVARVWRDDTDFVHPNRGRLIIADVNRDP